MFNVYGFATAQTDSNAQAQSLEQQATAPPETVIYATEDEAEAKALVDAGGFIDSSGHWLVATRYALEGVDTAETLAALPKSASRPLGEEPLLPDNSSATIDQAGRVHTDATKKPLKYNEADVEAIANEDLDIPIRKDIVDTSGNLGNYGKGNQGKP